MATIHRDGNLELLDGKVAVVDARCDPEEKCFPMVPAGAAAVDVLEMPDEEVATA